MSNIPKIPKKSKISNILPKATNILNISSTSQLIYKINNVHWSKTYFIKIHYKLVYMFLLMSMLCFVNSKKLGIQISEFKQKGSTITETCLSNRYTSKFLLLRLETSYNDLIYHRETSSRLTILLWRFCAVTCSQS